MPVKINRAPGAPLPRYAGPLIAIATFLVGLAILMLLRAPLGMFARAPML